MRWEGEYSGPQVRGYIWDIKDAGPSLIYSFPTRDLPGLGITLAGHQKKLLHNIQLLQQHLRQPGSVEV